MQCLVTLELKTEFLLGVALVTAAVALAGEVVEDLGAVVAVVEMVLVVLTGVAVQELCVVAA